MIDLNGKITSDMQKHIQGFKPEELNISNIATAIEYGMVLQVYTRWQIRRRDDRR